MPHAATSAESTVDLLTLCRAGDPLAKDRLLARFLPTLRRWATGRLPHYARANAETDDLVQLTMIRALNHIEAFVPQREGAFLAWLRSIFLNQLRDELRRVTRMPSGQRVTPDEVATGDKSPLEQMVGRQALAAYEKALTELSVTDREALLMRLEFGYQYSEIAIDLGLSSSNAARMRIVRAAGRLAQLINVESVKK